MLSIKQMWSASSTRTKATSLGNASFNFNIGMQGGINECSVVVFTKPGADAGRITVVHVFNPREVLTDDRIDWMSQGGQPLVHSKMKALVVMACCFQFQGRPVTVFGAIAIGVMWIVTVVSQAEVEQASQISLHALQHVKSQNFVLPSLEKARYKRFDLF